MTTPIIDFIKGYQVLDLIGEGAYGTVYRARQEAVDREVAVKIILPEFANRPEFIRRFETEAQLVAQLEHIHIVPLYDYWRDPQGAYLVMRLMKGGSLQDLINKGPLPLSHIAQLLDQVGSALSAAHRRGIIHRDLKPANILLDEDGNAYLSDFGIAKALGEQADLTVTGAILGTPAFITPEQVQSLPVSPQTDIYALGVLLFNMLTGKHPFPETSPGDLIARHLRDPLPPLGEVKPDLPPELDQVIQKATAKSPAERYPDVPSFLSDFHQVLGPELAPPPARPLTEQILAVSNPYKGLRPFLEADVEDFFGREELTRQLLARLGESAEYARFLAVVGPSGSGKSSLVKAGLLPALRQGALPGSEHWFIVTMTPGSRPLDELEVSLLRVAAEKPPDLMAQLQRDEHGLLRAAQLVLPTDNDQLLLVVDQFEELFTLTTDHTQSRQFMDLIFQTVSDPHSQVRVIITLRADFYDRPLMEPDFSALVQKRTEVVVPLTPAELERAICGPTERVGVSLEPGLEAEIMADVADQPGSLPLLQYALTELFERRQGRLLTREAYQSIGGVLGALGRRAEEVYQGLHHTGQALSRQVFLRLVSLGEGVEDTRRRVLRSELTAIDIPAANPSPGEDAMTVDQVLESYGVARLLSFDHDLQTRAPTVEVAHEALLREWGHLRQWLDESRADIRLQRLVGAAAQDWLQANQDPSFLLRGSRLAQFEDWAQETSLALTGDEKRFLQASLEDEAQRQAQQATLERRSRNFLRALVGVFAVATVVALVLTFFALNARNQATQQQQIAESEASQRATQQAIAESEAHQRATQQAIAESQADLRATAQAEAEIQRDEADRQAQIAFSRELVAAAGRNLETNPELSNWLALQADSVLRSAGIPLSLELVNMLHESVQASRLRFTLLGHSGEVWSVAYSPDGKLVASGSQDQTIRLWDATTGQELRLLAGHLGSVEDVVFSPDGKRLASASADGTAILWDLSSGEVELTLNPQSGPLWALAFSPDGKHLATNQDDKSVKVWDISADLATGQILLDLPDQGGLITFSPDGTYLATTGLDGAAHVWDVSTGHEVLSIPVETYSLDFSPDGTRLATGGQDDKVILWDASSGQELITLCCHDFRLRELEFNPDGSRLATAGQEGVAKVWDTESGVELITLAGTSGAIDAVAFSPECSGPPESPFHYCGRYLATGSRDGVIRIWDVSPAGRRELLTSSGMSGSYYPDSSQLSIFDLSIPNQGQVHRWESTPGSEPRETKLYALPPLPAPIVAGTSPNQRLGAVASYDGTVQVWDMESGQDLITYTLPVSPGWVSDLAFVPSGLRLVSMDNVGKITIWDVSTGQPLFSLPLPLPEAVVKYNRDGTQIATGGTDGIIKIWDSLTGQELFSLTGSIFPTFTFSPDGKLLASGGLDSVIKVWDLDTRELLFNLLGHTSTIMALEFSPDGKLLASGSLDGATKVWDVSSDSLTAGRELHHFSGPMKMVNFIFFSPDGKRLGTGSYWDQVVRVYTLDPKELISIANSRLTRPFTTQECQQYLHLSDCP